MKPAECLTGIDLDGGWHVDEMVRPLPDCTGGHFSVGYQVTHTNGKTAFMKALDFSGAFQSADPSRALQAMTAAYNFERDLLAKCKTRSLKRIATPLADGGVPAPGNHGPIGFVNYLIFDMASGDLRKTLCALTSVDIAWALRTLHQATIGLRQLHSIEVAHQDLKPSNVLIFPDAGAKVADLGRASDFNTPSPIDNIQVPGDCGYAPPEQWYNWRIDNGFNHRYLADIYHLGSLLHFLIRATSMTAALHHALFTTHGKAFHRGTFLSDLPAIIHAFNGVLDELKQAIGTFRPNSIDEIVLVVEQLCHPDPRRRGDPNARGTVRPQHDLQAYVSRFDRLAHKAEVGIL